MSFKEIKPEELEGNVFELICDYWPLLTAERDDQLNTMTINWGGMGYIWNKCITTVYVRPHRYTFEFIEAASAYSLCFFDKSYHEQMAYCGKVSGRDEDKIAKCGFTTSFIDDTPYFNEASIVIICKKIYEQNMDPAGFLDGTIHKNYPKEDYHKIYYGEILRILVKE